MDDLRRISGGLEASCGLFGSCSLLQVVRLTLFPPRLFINRAFGSHGVPDHCRHALLHGDFGGRSAGSFYALLHHTSSHVVDDDDIQSNGGSSNPFRGMGHTLFYMFKMLLLGDFDTDLFLLGEYVVLLRMLFVASMMLTLIILLNLLIALMSDSYERIQVTQLLPFSLLWSLL